MRPLAIILFATLLLSAACTRHAQTRTALDRADSLMTEHPDSALAILQAINGSALSDNSALNARYALLLTQAQVKNHLPVTDDSLISIAVHYYTDQDDPNAKMLSHYYKGEVNYKRKDYPLALGQLLKAYEIAQGLDDKFWSAMSAREISAIYNLTYNHNEELKYAIIAYNNFKLTDKQVHMICAASDLSRSYFNMHDNERALTLLTETLHMAQTKKMQSLKADLLVQLGKYYISIRDYDKAKQSWEKVCKLPVADAEDSIYLALTYAYLGSINKASELLSRIKTKTQSPTQYYLMYKINKETGKYKEALETFEVVDSITNEAFKGKISQGISNAVTVHFEESNRLTKATHERVVYRLWMMIVLILLSMTILCMIAYNRYRQHKQTIKGHIDLAHQLQESLSLKEQEIMESQNRITDLLSSHFEEFDFLCKISFESAQSTKEQQRISNEVKKLIKTFSTDTKKIKELEGMVNKHYDNIMISLRNDYKKMNEIEYRFFLFNILGFSKKAQAVFLGKDSVSAIYSLRRHFIDKLRMLNPSACEKYIALLNK